MIHESQCSLDTLLCMMKAHYGKDMILLVDEYDVPLVKASDNKYYKEMPNVIKKLLGMAWKSNERSICCRFILLIRISLQIH